MKRLIIIFFLVSYSIISIGVAANIHYCKDKLISFSFFSLNKKSCCKKAVMKKGCCHNYSIEIKKSVHEKNKKSYSIQNKKTVDFIEGNFKNLLVHLKEFKSFKSIKRLKINQSPHLEGFPSTHLVYRQLII